jgi:hypothetical protein
MFKRLAFLYCSDECSSSSGGGNSSLTASIRETDMSHLSIFDDSFVEETPEDMLVVESINSRSDGNISSDSNPNLNPNHHVRTGNNSKDHYDPPAEVFIIMEMTRSSAIG